LDPAATGSGDRRRLGLVSTSVLVVASMVGAGVFTTSGYRARGPAEARGGAARVGARRDRGTSGALCYGALARAIPESGGEYTFLSRTVHRWRRRCGLDLAARGFTAPIAVTALGLQSYLDSTFALARRPALDRDGRDRAAPGSARRCACGPGVMAQNAAVALKLTLIAAFVLVGAWRLPAAARARLPRVDPISATSR
jgi:APA family basic amino acid/polyamine antiporter